MLMRRVPNYCSRPRQVKLVGGSFEEHRLHEPGLELFLRAVEKTGFWVAWAVVSRDWKVLGACDLGDEY